MVGAKRGRKASDESFSDKPAVKRAATGARGRGNSNIKRPVSGAAKNAAQSCGTGAKTGVPKAEGSFHHAIVIPDEEDEEPDSSELDVPSGVLRRLPPRPDPKHSDTFPYFIDGTIFIIIDNQDSKYQYRFHKSVLANCCRQLTLTGSFRVREFDQSLKDSDKGHGTRFELMLQAEKWRLIKTTFTMQKPENATTSPSSSPIWLKTPGIDGEPRNVSFPVVPPEIPTPQFASKASLRLVEPLPAALCTPKNSFQQVPDSLHISPRISGEKLLRLLLSPLPSDLNSLSLPEQTDTATNSPPNSPGPMIDVGPLTSAEQGPFDEQSALGPSMTQVDLNKRQASLKPTILEDNGLEDRPELPRNESNVPYYPDSSQTDLADSMTSSYNQNLDTPECDEDSDIDWESGTKILSQSPAPPAVSTASPIVEMECELQKYLQTPEHSDHLQSISLFPPARNNSIQSYDYQKSTKLPTSPSSNDEQDAPLFDGKSIPQPAIEVPMGMNLDGTAQDEDEVKSIRKHRSADGLAPKDVPRPPPHICEAYNNMFLIFHHQSPNIDKSDINLALEQCEQLFTRAKVLAAEAIVRPSICTALYNFGLDLYKAIAAQSARFLKFSLELESAPLFKEAMIHVVGTYTAWSEEDFALLKTLSCSVQNLIYSKHIRLVQDRTRLNIDLLTSTIHLNSEPVTLSSARKDNFDTWLVVQLWRDYFCHHLPSVETRAFHQPGTLYRKLLRAGDSYLPIEAVRATLLSMQLGTVATDKDTHGRLRARVLDHLGSSTFSALVDAPVASPLRNSNIRYDATGPGSFRDLAWDLNLMKDYAKESVKEICVNNSMLDVEAMGIEYLTCTKIEDAELPWIVARDGGSDYRA